MKRKRLFFGLLLLILLCFVIFYPNSDEHPNPNAPFSNKPTRDQENRSVETPSISFNDLKHTNNEVEISGASRLEREQQLQQRAEANWKMPISFYGKVVDEDGNPISDANVEFVWQALSGTPKVTTTSDEQGLFRLEGKVGKLLGVYLEKEGYYVSRREQNSFDYGSPSAHNFHVADPSSPVVFQLRKRGAGADLITSHHGISSKLNIKPPVDGDVVRVDLLNRRTDAHGQINISQIKPPYQSWREALEWTVRIDIPDGGFIEHNEEFPFEAPESGYQSPIEFHFKRDQPDWSVHLRKNFYIKFGNPPRYGRLSLDTSIMKSSIGIEYAINPDGSRYLEPKFGR